MARVPIQVGHSADPDDAFMVWALEAGRVDTRGLELQPVASDIQTLNEWAVEGRLEVTALSAGAYPAVADRYVLLTHGASFGEGYGPIVVARERALARRAARARDRHARPADDGDPRAAARARRRHPHARPAVRPMLDEVTSGRADAGLLIHEGQLTFADAGLHKLLDLGVWWQAETNLPLPLGVVAARRDLERLDDVSAVLRESIEAGLANRDEALAYAMTLRPRHRRRDRRPSSSRCTSTT